VNYLRHGDETVEYSAPDDFVLNSPIAARNTTLTGYGLWLGPDYFVAEDLAAGRLVRVLPDYATVDQPILAVFAHRTHVPAKIRVFSDYLVEVFSRRADLTRQAVG
jgi:DNA-binding transcriptional LysR family regulator